MDVIIVEYIIELDQFEGPLDLLLHLIKEANIDIFDINLEDITKQYLDYLNKLEEKNLNIASEYLVMAAELIEMKSRTLLPRNEENLEEEDPRTNLINRLIEYKAYKMMAPTFHDLEDNRGKYYTKNPSLEITGIDLSPQISDDIDMDLLMKALNNLLLRKQLEKPLKTKIANREYSVSVRSREIKEILNKKKSVKFEELFDTFEKDFVVVTFLSILVLAKNQEILLEQNDNFDSLFIKIRV